MDRLEWTPNDHTTLVVPLKSGLANGLYTVNWVSVSAKDGWGSVRAVTSTRSLGGCVSPDVGRSFGLREPTLNASTA
jgi:hypothetical protein